ncbi:hypothetical protein [Variovorax sp. J31P207]|nr:hypothetical protein [Variovorax sp. J31P207]MDM0072466.1 hypothetical protein [Variovorax sp. J31P207]
MNTSSEGSVSEKWIFADRYAFDRSLIPELLANSMTGIGITA